MSPRAWISLVNTVSPKLASRQGRFAMPKHPRERCLWDPRVYWGRKEHAALSDSTQGEYCTNRTVLRFREGERSNWLAVTFPKEVCCRLHSHLSKNNLYIGIKWRPADDIIFMGVTTYSIGKSVLEPRQGRIETAFGFFLFSGINWEKKSLEQSSPPEWWNLCMWSSVGSI